MSKAKGVSLKQVVDTYVAELKRNGKLAPDVTVLDVTPGNIADPAASKSFLIHFTDGSTAELEVTKRG